jgi:glycerophosphoryl diester phosphodiesterase
LDAAFAGTVKAAGLKLYVWTVNDVPTAKRMAALGVDGITTDDPDLCARILTGTGTGTAAPR